MKEIALNQLLYMLKDGIQNNNRYCFILGAGASRESGIKTGVELAKKWYGEIVERYSPEEIKRQMDALGIDDVSVSSKNYFSIYDLRFYPQYKDGYAEIERAMEKAEPSYGYYPFAYHIANTPNNLVITTNFDTMIEDALFIYTDKRPLVVGHESLAGYLDVNTSRPVIAKIHRGLFYNPLNRRTDLKGLSEQWVEVLKTVFQIYTPIVIGYAGGDGSLMKFLQNKSVEMKNGLYWCYYKKDPVSKEIQDLLRKKGGHAVPTDGFDAMMFALSEIMGYEDPSDHIQEAAQKRLKLFHSAYAQFSENMNAITNPDEEQLQLMEMLESANIRLTDELKQKLLDNPTADEYVRLGGLLKDAGQNEEAVLAYTEAVRLDPVCWDAYNYRGLVYLKLEQYLDALKDFSKYIEMQPGDAVGYNNRGSALVKLKQFPQARADLDKAIEIRAEFANPYRWLGEIAIMEKNWQLALDHLSKAIKMNPYYDDAHQSRAMVYRELGDQDQACADVHWKDELFGTDIDEE